MSGKRIVDSKMQYRKENVPMGLPGFSEYAIWQTEEEQVQQARLYLDKMEKIQ